MQPRYFVFGGGRRAVVSLLAIMAACTLPTEAARAGIVAYWNFNDNFNASEGGSGYDLTSVNGASIQAAAARFGSGGADFERASSQYAFVNNATVVTSGADFSYSAWYYLDLANIPNTSDRYFVIEATTTAEVGYPISLGLRDLNSDFEDDVAQIYTSINNGAIGTNASVDTLPNQTWHNVITTYDASTRDMTFYFDGNTFGTTTLTAAVDAADRFVVGGHRSGTGRNWEGYIDDVAIWDEVIDSTEIARLQTQPVVPVPEPSSVLLACTGLLSGGGMLLRRCRPTSLPK